MTLQTTPEVPSKLPARSPAPSRHTSVTTVSSPTTGTVSPTNRPLLNADLSKEEREMMQIKVEKLHRAWTSQLEYLAPPTTGKLADLDPAQIVTPPKGFEIGYVPIATRQELDKL